jgi:hypothetical protein
MAVFDVVTSVKSMRPTELRSYSATRANTTWCKEALYVEPLNSSLASLVAVS